jgi:hypothetical protein
VDVDRRDVEPAWDGSFAANADAQRRRRAEETSPEERLAWLEEAIRFAHSVGALPRGRDEQHVRPDARRSPCA